MACFRNALQHAYAAADELHYPKACPLAQTVVLFGDYLECGIDYDAREVEMYMGLELTGPPVHLVRRYSWEGEGRERRRPGFLSSG